MAVVSKLILSHWDQASMTAMLYVNDSGACYTVQVPASCATNEAVLTYLRQQAQLIVDQEAAAAEAVSRNPSMSSYVGTDIK